MIDQIKLNANESISKMLREIERVESYSTIDWENKRFGGKIKASISGQGQFLHMQKCRGGKSACSSVFCPKCNKVMISNIHREMLDYFEKEFQSKDWVARKSLRYGTVLHELVPVNVDNLFQEEGVIRDLIVSVARLKENLKIVENVLKRAYPSHDVYAVGSVHLELLDVDLFRIEKVGRESDKQKTLRKWFTKVGLTHDLYFLVHCHFMIDGKKLKREQLEDAFRSIPEWNVTKEQVLIKRFTSQYVRGQKHTLKEAFDNISRYAFSGSNGSLRFNTAWGNTDSEYRQIEKRDGMYRLKVYAEKTGRPNIGEELTVGHIRLLIKAHNTFTDDGEDGLRIGMGMGNVK